ncbi:DUF982 domain-containing protein [Kaistia terrae]|uniref:DUF982 domain-containing protein n=1 Tax=Kaistia terrae TaxID=537017 RepID=A0ABW0Q0V5_9HYPH|nr:DUF982 domain-containing protein [Kaistia terrae]MCX5579961.1 DUF982 domain-containing protein [Kaistia terrae]
MKHAFRLVFVWEGVGARRAIGDVLRAAEWLTDDWPADFRGTKKHIAAMEMCVLELEGEALPDDVRHMFIEAAREADVLAAA